MHEGELVESIDVGKVVPVTRAVVAAVSCTIDRSFEALRIIRDQNRVAARQGSCLPTRLLHMPSIYAEIFLLIKNFTSTLSML